MATATLQHGYDPHLVRAHLGIDANWVTRESDYWFEIDCEQAALDAAVAGAIAWAVPPTPVPESVESHKIKIALTALGWRAEVEDLVETSSQSIKDAWTAPYMSRNSVLLNQCALVLEKSDAQVDDLFRLANSLVT